MSAFAQAARVFLLVALCWSAAYADMSSAPPPVIVLAAATLPDNDFLAERKTGDIALPTIGVVKPEIDSPHPIELSPNEPFGSKASAALPADISEKWRDLQSRIDADEKALVVCRADESTCSPAAHRFLALVDLGRQRAVLARLRTVNRAVNLSIRPVSDLDQYGYPDYWASPLQTLGSGAGDCEDYAIVKYVALRDMGFDAADLRFVIVHDNMHQTEHAVIAVRDGQDWLILDNRTMAILSSGDVRHYQPLFSLDQQGTRAFASAAPNSVTDR